MKNLFIVNPNAGKNGKSKVFAQEVTAYCEKNDIDYEIYYTKAPMDGLRYLKEYLAEDDNVRVYSFGGDGTLFEAVNAAVEFKNVEIGIFPLGSGNDFVRLFDDKTKFFDIEAQLNGEAVVLDVMKCNDQYAVSQCSMGMDAETCANQVRFKKIKGISGETAFHVSALYCIIKKFSNTFTIKTDDDDEYTKELLFCLGGNSRWYGGGYKGAPDALPNDGLIDLVTIDYMGKNRLKLLKLLPKYKAGTHKEMPITTIKRCKKVTIKTAKPAAVNVDGECFYTTETSFEIVPNAIKFIIPKGCNMDLS